MKISFIGTGAWATALANVAANNKHEVVLYGIDENEVKDINNNHKNSKYFKDILINESIKATLSLNESINNASIIVIAVPSIAIKSVLHQINEIIDNKPIILNVSKGFDSASKNTILQVIRKEINNESFTGLVSLVGPSFAEEVINGEFTAIAAVSSDENAAKIIQEVFSSPVFRVYTNSDEIGCEYCSALKNVIAIASGILTGLNYGANSHAALITRGLAEISRFVIKMGGNEKTCLGLTGVGDLVLTCSSLKSRNYLAGIEIGKLKSSEEFYKTNKKTVEGIYACKIAYEIAKEKGIYAPIISSVYHVLYNNSNPEEEIYNLMNRSLKEE